MKESVPIPCGKHAGKLIEHLPDIIVNAMFQSWRSGALARNSFFPVIEEEMVIRDLLDEDGEPKIVLNFMEFKKTKKQTKRSKKDSAAFAKKFAPPPDDGEFIDDGLGIPFTPGKFFKHGDGTVEWIK